MAIIKGKVIHGTKKGRTLGFPTANINVANEIDLGIYAGYIFIESKKYKSAIYSSGNKILEAFIFDFSEDLYGKEINVELVKKIRDKKVFKNDAEASEQISKDVSEIKKLLK